MKSNRQVANDFKLLDTPLTKRQVSKARRLKGSLPLKARRFIKQGLFKKAAGVINDKN